MSHPFLSKRKEAFYGNILRVSRVTKEWLRSGTKRGEKGGFIDHFYATTSALAVKVSLSPTFPGHFLTGECF